MEEDSQKHLEDGLSDDDKYPRKKSDEFLKGAIEENLPDLIRFLYPNADGIFDFQQGFEMMNTELYTIIPDRERQGGSRRADLLVKVWLKDGSEQLILLNLEIEGGNDPYFSYRAYEYNYRINDRYKLPVATIVIYTGDKTQKRPSEYIRKVLDTTISFRYRTYHIFDDQEEELLAMDNIFALIVVACQKALLEGKVAEKELGEGRTTIARTLLARKKYDNERITSFLVFLKNFIFIKNKQINRIFDEYLFELSGGTINMGIIETLKLQERREGKLEGEEKKNAEFVTNLIEQTDFDDAKIASLAVVSIDFVQKVRASLNKKRK